MICQWCEFAEPVDLITGDIKCIRKQKILPRYADSCDMFVSGGELLLYPEPLTPLGIMITEYLSKCRACDECIADYYCREHGLKLDKVPLKFKLDRVPHTGCIYNLVDYLNWRTSLDNH